MRSVSPNSLLTTFFYRTAINRYQLIDRIGGGGFSEVWLAHDTNAGIDVALKIYTPNSELDEEGKEDFKKEFARLCGLNHSNIIHAIGFGIHNEELPYLAMSVCRNGSAKKLIGYMEEEQLWDFVEQVAIGLRYLHDHDITHKDIKPDNVLINSDGQYLIIDFGISTKTRNTLRKSTKGAVGGGTPWYMSVESWGTESPDIHARDIWALGATLYEIITGDVPFGQYGGVTQKSQNGKIPPITNNVSDELKQLVYDCLALNAWDRPDADAIVKRAKDHKEGVTPHPPFPILFKKIALGTIVFGIIAGCYFAYPDVVKYIIDVIDNKNDSIYLAKINKAVAITETVRDKNVIKEKEIGSFCQTLCNAANIYAEAESLDVTDSIKEKGCQIWFASQQIIDNAFKYMYEKKCEYKNIGAESAYQSFNNGTQELSRYVTPEIRDSIYNSNPYIRESEGILIDSNTKHDSITRVISPIKISHTK